MSHPHLTRISLLLATVALGAAGFAGTAFAQDARKGESRPIPGRYIVVYKDSVADPDEDSDRKVRAAGGRKHHAYRKAIKGFSADLSDAAVARLRADPDVAYVEQDQTVYTTDVENQATWGLDRIDQADRPYDSQYHYTATGAGVFAFIIDTGIRRTHTEFAGRVADGFSNISDGRGTADCDGHGTHVSGTVGGSLYGVAKGVTLVPVRVLDCTGSGTWSGVIAGIDWVAQQTLMRPAVANMSLGGAKSDAVNAAVARAVAAGVTVVVAAGNENKNACDKSPASEPTAITVGATTDTDSRASFSNYGTCVDLFAPGVNIKSSWPVDTKTLVASDTATNTISGTSMASPHAAGVAALALQANPAATPAAISQFLVSTATTNRLTSLGTGSANRLLYSLGSTGVGTPTTPTEPQRVVIAVKSLQAQNVISKASWYTKVTVTVRNVANGAAQANAVVQGSFSPGGAGQCTTSATGTCTITSAMFTSKIAATVFTVTGVSATGADYDRSQNSATQVTITQR